MRKEVDCLKTLATREQERDSSLEKSKGIALDRLLWRAQGIRHITHVMPGQRILELGCGRGIFTRKLLEVTRGENPITAISFLPHHPGLEVGDSPVEFIRASETFPVLEGKRFDVIVAMDILDEDDGPLLMEHMYQLLEPGGQLVCYERNPWNVLHKCRAFFQRHAGQLKPAIASSRPQLYELMSEIGFVRVFSIYNDFVHAFSTGWISWLFRNMSAVLENIPGLRTFAKSILIHGQKPPRKIEYSDKSLCVHEQFRHAISIVIPCRNEERNLETIVARLRHLFGEYIHEMILVDDNSEDDTRTILQRLSEQDRRITPLFRVPPNGVGYAIADGYRVATGRYILSLDCDSHYLIPELRDFFDAAADGYEVIIGSRFSRHSLLLNYGFRRIMPNRIFHVLAQILLLRPFRDVTNNIKLIRKDVVKKLQLTEPGFAVNAEIGLQSILMGGRVKEVPISWMERTFDMGSPSFSVVRFGWGYFRVLCRLWMKCVFGIGMYRTLPVPKREKMENFRETVFMKNA